VSQPVSAKLPALALLLYPTYYLYHDKPINQDYKCFLPHCHVSILLVETARFTLQSSTTTAIA
jgi:hypothetical protein